jgi:DNA-binding NtrC family response regulator
MSCRRDRVRREAQGLARQEHRRQVLDRLGGNKSRAAKVLGIDRKTLREKLKRLGLNAGQSRQGQD